MIGFSRSHRARIVRWLPPIASRVPPGCGGPAVPVTARLPERSAPVQKPLPTPVRTTARISGSVAQRWRASKYKRRMSAFMALRASGRLSVIHPTPFSTVKSSGCVSAIGSDLQVERPDGVVVEEALLDLGGELEPVDLPEHALPLQQGVVGGEAHLVLA